MPAREIFRLTTNAGRPLVGTLDLPDGSGAHPTIVACHGFKGFMEWGFFPSLAELLAARGFVVIRFNFTGSGMQPGDELVTDLQAFRDNTFSREVDETLEILDAAGDRLAPGRVDRQRVGLFGHSRGGGIALLAAADPAWSARLKALVTWAAVSGFDRASPAMKDYWRRTGVLPFSICAPDRSCRSASVCSTTSRPTRRLSTSNARRRGARLLVGRTRGCGRNGPQRGRPSVARGGVAAGGTARSARGDHGLGGKHPFRGPTPQLIQAMNATVAWYRRHLLP